MSRELIVDCLGWLGAAELLLAYWLVSVDRLAGSSATYQVLNLSGSSLLIINTFYYGAYPSTVVNTIWIAIGLFVLLKNRCRVLPR